MTNRQHTRVSFAPPLACVAWSTFVLASLHMGGHLAAHAQMHHVDAPERVTRAIGVYEWTGELSKPSAARFVPVSLFIDGRFEDAGLYLARPVPFALQPGDVYALERAGEPQGVLDLDFAHRVVTGKALADDNTLGAWYGFGKFTPHTAPKEAPLQASSHLPRLEQSAGPNTPAGTKLPAPEPDSDRPHMSRRDSPGTAGTPKSGTDVPDSTAPASPQGSDKADKSDKTADTGTPSRGSSDDDTDRPTLRRRDPALDAQRRKEANSRNKTASVTAAGPALGDDPDRPVLGRNDTDNAGTPELTGLPADLHQAVAVSDASHTDTHPFARAWDSPAERTETTVALEALARKRVEEYLATNRLIASNEPLPAPGSPLAPTGQATAPAPNPAVSADSDEPPPPPRLQRGIPQPGKTPPPATAAAARVPAPTAATPARPISRTAQHPGTRTTAHAGTLHTTPLRLQQEDVSGFTLSYGGLPTFVYTAAASVRLAQAASATQPNAGTTSSTASLSGLTVATPTAAYVTVVAQRLPSGEIQVALSAVTDNAHLDRGPRLRLIDAVDPDDSHRASLLFELRGGSSRQFALYRLTSARAEQTFTTASIE